MFKKWQNLMFKKCEIKWGKILEKIGKNLKIITRALLSLVIVTVSL